MNKMKRTMAATLGCILAVSGLTACGSIQSDGTETLEYMGAPATGTPQRKAIEKLVAKFEKANPNTKIKLVTGTSSYESDIKVRLSGNNAPDIFNTHGWSRDRYANFLEPLQNRSWAKNVSPVIDSSIKNDKGEFYALPMQMAVTGITYNATVLKRAGVDPSSIASWDDFSDACAKVTATGAACIGASGKENWTVGQIVDYSAYGMFSDSELKNMKNGEFESGSYQKLASMIKKWAEEKYFNVDYTAATSDDLSKMLANDTLAFTFQGISAAANITNYNPDVKLGFIPYPSGNGDPYIVSGEDYALGVSKTSKHKDAALKFIDFMAQPENYQVYTDATSSVPAVKGVQAQLGVMSDSYDTWITKKSTETVPVFDRVYLPNGIWNTMCTTTDGLVTGQMDANAATGQMKTQFESLSSSK